IVMRYSIPKTGAFIDIDMRIFWAERARMLKLEIPCAFTAERYIGDGVFGFDNLKTDGTECAAQKWVRAENSSAALAVLNRGTYGSDFRANAIRITVLRSPMYAGHPLRGALAAPDDRYMPHSDMGERSVSFRLLFGSADELAGRIAREALAYNEQPYLLSFFPSGNGDARLPFLSMQGDGVIMSSIRPAAAGNSLNIRLVEMTGQERSIVLSIPNRKIERTIAFKPHEIKSIEI
ncbi:MAG TPA: hypothetical protein DC049_11170, partial [Spirochaetia bacterium]|nr:hypothetical protein [Spirochaetia bacterium]